MAPTCGVLMGLYYSIYSYMIITASQSVSKVAAVGEFEELLRNIADENEKNHDKCNLL